MTGRGPLVVRGELGMLADDPAAIPMRYRTVVDLARTLGAGVVFVLGELPDAALWDEADTVEITGREGSAPAWRYRVTGAKATRTEWPPVTVVLVDRDEGRGGPWAGLTGRELATTLRVLQALLGVPWAHSVGRTAEHLILSTHPRAKGGTKLDRAPVIPEPVRSARVEQPWTAWQRPRTEAERGRAWLHVYDGNAAFLGAWRADLGMGEPEHVDAAGAVGRTRRPGIWRVELGAGWHDGEGLPPIAPALTPLDDGGRGGWVTTPTLRRLDEWARAQGWPEVEPVEGWVWPRGPRFLSAAADRLAKTREAARAEDTAAQAVLAEPGLTDEQADAALLRIEVAERVEAAVKDLYRVTVGRLSSRHAYVSQGWQRPDWANTLRAAYRTSLHRKLAAWGQPPVAVMTDAVAYLTDEPDPVAFAHQLGMRLGHEVGTMKHAGSCPAAEVDELLGGGAGELRDAFDRAATWRPVIGTLRSRL